MLHQQIAFTYSTILLDLSMYFFFVGRRGSTLYPQVEPTNLQSSLRSFSIRSPSLYEIRDSGPRNFSITASVTENKQGMKKKKEERKFTKKMLLTLHLFYKTGR